MTKIDQQKIDEILEVGVEEIFDRENLIKKLNSGKQLRIKHGIDPTGPKIHLGRAFQFWKLKEFQDLGHKIVLIIGDFTAQIGDASDKQAMRKTLMEKEIKENMKDYMKQIGKILDIKKVELHYNSEWFKKMKIRELLYLSMIFTAQQAIQRKNFKERWDEGKPIGLHELSYPLLQGYDSVAVKADVETGGFDQLFNLQTGREIQRKLGQKPQDIIILKMLSGLDGHKMSTSQGNIISIVDEPNDMYGKIMSIGDELIEEYFELTTSFSENDIEEIKKLHPNPRDKKAILAKEVVKIYYNENIAQKAQGEFERVHKEKEWPLEYKKMEKYRPEVPILELLLDGGLVPSKSEAKRLILQGAVKINGQDQEDWKKIIKTEKGMRIQVGKRRFLELI